MDDEFALRYRHARQHVLAGQQVQLRRGGFIGLHKHKAPLRPRYHPLGHDQAIAHGPNNLRYHIASQQGLQQLAAQLVKGKAFQDGGHHLGILGGPGIACGAWLHLPVFANQGQLAFLQPGKHLAIAAQVAVQLHAALAALQQQRVIGAQHTHVGGFKRVAQAVGKLCAQLWRGGVANGGRRGCFGALSVLLVLLALGFSHK